jgi:hypothetical protein
VGLVPLSDFTRLGVRRLCDVGRNHPHRGDDPGKNAAFDRAMTPFVFPARAAPARIVQLRRCLRCTNATLSGVGSHDMFHRVRLSTILTLPANTPVVRHPVVKDMA